MYGALNVPRPCWHTGRPDAGMSTAGERNRLKQRASLPGRECCTSTPRPLAMISLVEQDLHEAAAPMGGLLPNSEHRIPELAVTTDHRVAIFVQEPGFRSPLTWGTASRTHRGGPPGTAPPAGRALPARDPAAAYGPGGSERAGPAGGRWLRRSGPRRPARPGRACPRRVRHPGDRGGQVQVPHRYPRGPGPAWILTAPAVCHCGWDAHTRRGGPGPAHGRAVPAARRTAPC